MNHQQLNVGVIGLGVMGQRMLARLAAHPQLQPTLIWDANPAALAKTLQQYPQLKAATSAAQLIAAPGLHSLYIATPPAPHMALTELAFDAGLAVFCEKPLTVDFAAARLCIDRIALEGQRAAVNFALASSKGLGLLLASPREDWRRVELEVSFARWPRPWQAAAGAWLGERAEGGFTREVLSHFIFVLQRVLGPARVLSSVATYPQDGRSAETELRADLDVAGVAVGISGKVGGKVGDDMDDQNRMLWSTGERELELKQWFSEIEQRGCEAQIPAQLAQIDQLDQWAAMIEGRPHSLPGYAEALAVQQTIESLLNPSKNKE
ncbi:Gfo/Idh/MocA family oxidoreductase [Paucibacter sp. TC2R-5]|uniref:Gfo/Idh/MocA family protein n=1 Tax=Paucibacter sp. TC2R-5 TaxID=2893555 RepID=UPI0021E50D54|nr:Gfo/Idh/MocA family oxidoreductase [Paucibacter sp. TC2R-5]MCV2359554.1 Gfo/Idh/MocA family oxidoreductase [Paucibacter sp. TC2R-5]